jgi:hypothetical protein
VPSPDGNTWAYWTEATDAQVSTLDAAWCEDQDDITLTDDDEPPPLAYATHHMLDQNEIFEAAQRVAAKVGLYKLTPPDP